MATLSFHADTFIKKTDRVKKCAHNLLCAYNLGYFYQNLLQVVDYYNQDGSFSY